MLLKALRLRDFGTYKGPQEFNLETDHQKNVILIGGQNGAGKSTFLEAIRLCFYGPLASKSTNSRDRYHRYLLDRIHRDSTSAIPSRSASVSVEFQFADIDGVSDYVAFREWHRSLNNSVDESFTLSRDGHPLSDVDASHWQEFIQELVPLGVSDLFFFDGEKVQLLAEDESDARTLGDAVRNLLGTDIVEKLHADLSLYQSRALQRAAVEDESAAELNALATAIEVQRSRVSAAEIVSVDAVSALETKREELARLEQTFQMQGGNYARNRGRLEERRKQLTSKVQLLETSIREHATTLLPLAFVPSLMRQMLKQLEVERDFKVGAVVDENLAKAAKATISALRRMTFKRGGKDVALNALVEFGSIESLVQRAHKPIGFDAPLVHDLSGEAEQRIQGWAHASLHVLPAEIQEVGRQLEDLYREQQKVERDISRVPSEETLKPVMDEIQRARKDVAETTSAAAEGRLLLEQARDAVLKAEANYKKVGDSIASNDAQAKARVRAAKAQSVLEEFKNILISRKVKQIEGELTGCFSVLSRKKVRRSFAISSSTFQVSISDSHGRAIPKSELSAGEKQIYAISVLWALARVSGRPLPIIIDTPLARLDSEHRALLGENYFPGASHQVIILSTDTEIDSTLLPIVRPYVARSYELLFDASSQSTSISEGYFTTEAV